MTETFREMMQEAQNRIPLYSDDWVNFLPSDPGMTILEVLTYYQAIQRDRMEEMPEEVKEHLLRMAGFSRRKEKSAALYVRPENPRRGIPIEKGQKFWTHGLCFEAEDAIGNFRGRLSGVYRMEEGEPEEILELREGVPLHAEIFGPCPKEGDKVYLLFEELPDTDGDVELLLYADVWQEMPRNPFVPGKERMEDKAVRFAEISFACYNGQKYEPVACEDDTYGFLEDGEIRLRFRKEQTRAVEFSGKKGYLFRCMLVQADYDIPPAVTEIYGPLIRLKQKETKIFTRDGETYFSTPEMSVYGELGLLYGYDRQEFDISGLGMVDGDSLRLKTSSGENEFAPGEKGLRYEYKRDRKKIQILDAGDCEGDRVWVSQCAATAGALGNIRKKNRLSAECNGEELYFFNPLEGRGGRDYESLEDAGKRFIKDLRTPVSAVTTADYEYLAKNVPGLCIRKVRAYCGKGDGCVWVVVLPYGREACPGLSQIYRRRILTYLGKRKLLNTKIEVKAPDYLNVDVYVKVRKQERKQEREIERELQRMLMDALDYRRNQEQIGAPIRYAVLFEKAECLPGVAGLCEFSIRPEGRQMRGRYPGEVILIPESAVCVPGEIIVEII